MSRVSIAELWKVNSYQISISYQVRITFSLHGSIKVVIINIYIFNMNIT